MLSRMVKTFDKKHYVIQLKEVQHWEKLETFEPRLIVRCIVIQDVLCGTFLNSLK